MAEEAAGARNDSQPGEPSDRRAEKKTIDGRRDLAFSAALFVIALLPRLYVAIAWAREPVWDGHYYDFGARRIAAGLGYSDDIIVAGRTVWHPWCHYPVGYSGFLGIIYRIFGSGQDVAPVANAVTGALLAVVVHRLARYAASPLRARIAGLLAALSPGLIVYAALLMTEPLAGLGILTAAWLFARDAAQKPVRGALLAGLAFGLTALVRPQSLLCVPGLALIALAASPKIVGAQTIPTLARPFVRAAALSGIALAVSFAVIAPWTLRNCRVMDGCALVSTNAGWNLAIGAFPRATGRFETIRSSDGCPIVTGQVQQDRCWRQEGLKWILADPWRWLGLIPKKLGYTFDHESFPMGYLGEANPSAWPPERQAAGRNILTFWHGALLAIAPLAFVARPGIRRVVRLLRSRSEALPRRGQRLLREIVQVAALLAIGGLAAAGALAEPRFLWPLAVAIPVLWALPLPGAPSRGGVLGYLAFTVATVCVTHAVFFGEDRYHIVTTPVICILAACTLRRSEECVRGAEA
ncbi:MAG: glycosyltransferase family 39 protein [Polyangiaceae bacterium]|nr:glycosyltransferase family 39 protein [Polyangiaceae bacterium]